MGQALVWHPWIRALGWLSLCFFSSWCAAVIWEVAAGAELQAGPVLARAAWIWLALLLCSGLLVVFDIWTGVLGHGYSNYHGGFVVVVCASATVVFLAVAAAYLWVVSWPLEFVWPWLQRMGASLPQPHSGDSSHLPLWLTWLLLAGASLLALRFVVAGARHTAEQLVDGFRLLGFWRALRGAMLMFLLRHRLPARDLFMMSPVLSPIPFIALSAWLYSAIEIPVFKWALPLLVLLYAALHMVDMLVPPLWLYLGLSNFESFASFYRLRGTWRKNGLTLLNRVGWDGVKFYAAWRRTLPTGSMFYDPSAPRVWSLRTRDDMWETTVLNLMDYVPVVVVDVRGESDIVREELEWLQHGDRRRKAWYLVANGDRVAADNHRAVIERYAQVDAYRLVSEATLAEAVWTQAGLSWPTIGQPHVLTHDVQGRGPAPPDIRR